MNRTIRGMAGLLVALGASACANDWSLDYETPPTQIFANPAVLFVTQGDSVPLLLRLVNDINQSVPAKFDVSNVPNGLEVNHDDNYRPDYVNPDGTLQQPELLTQQRYFVKATLPIGATFTVSSGSITKEIRVNVIPKNLGAALSATAPAVGDPVTINAQGGVSFTGDSKVTVPGGGEAVIVSQSAKSIQFIPVPGSNGVVTIDNIVLDYAPTLDARTLSTTDTLSVPAITAITGSFSTGTPAAGAVVQFSSPGFKFLPSTSVMIGSKVAAVVGISGDSSTISILPPVGVTGPAMITNAVLSFLTSVPLAATPTTATLTTPGTFTATALPNTDDPGSGSPALQVNTMTPMTGVFDGGTWTGADAVGGGGPNKWYSLTVGGDAAADYAVQVDWSGTTADLDLYMTDEAVANFVGSTSASAGSSHPEGQTIHLDPGNYWIVVVNWSHKADPDWIFPVVH